MIAMRFLLCQVGYRFPSIRDRDIEYSIWRVSTSHKGKIINKSKYRFWLTEIRIKESQQIGEEGIESEKIRPWINRRLKEILETLEVEVYCAAHFLANSFVPCKLNFLSSKLMDDQIGINFVHVAAFHCVALLPLQRQKVNK